MNHYLEALKQDLVNSAALMYTISRLMEKASEKAATKNARTRIRGKSNALVARGNQILGEVNTLGKTPVISREIITLIKEVMISTAEEAPELINMLTVKLDAGLAALNSIPRRFVPVEALEIIDLASKPFFKPSKKKVKKYSVTVVGEIRTPAVISFVTDEIEDEEAEELEAKTEALNDESEELAENLISEDDIQNLAEAAIEEAAATAAKVVNKVEETVKESVAEATEAVEDVVETISTTVNETVEEVLEDVKETVKAVKEEAKAEKKEVVVSISESAAAASDAMFDALIASMEAQQAEYMAQPKAYTEETVAKFTKKSWFDRMLGL